MVHKHRQDDLIRVTEIGPVDERDHRPARPSTDLTGDGDRWTGNSTHTAHQKGDDMTQLNGQNKKRLGIIGATGYVGMELCRLLVNHPGFELTALCSKSYAGQNMADLYPWFRGRLEQTLCPADVDDLASRCDVVITALPHGVSSQWVPQLLDKGLVVLDHSGDFRFHELTTYQAAYKLDHPRPDLLAEAVYGLPELFRDRLKTARLISNPGCYPTCTILALAPLVKSKWFDPDTAIIVDAVSGTSGAGRKSDPTYGMAEMALNFKPYGVVGHRHAPEMIEKLSDIAGLTVSLTFTPHLLPIGRGMMATIYVKPAAGGTIACKGGALAPLYNDYYKDEPFVRILPKGSLPQVAAVAGSNFADIQAVYDPASGLIKIFSAIDNLGKGACAQAVQALNVRFGFPETTGLEALALGI